MKGKRCTLCGVEYPATLDNFPPSARPRIAEQDKLKSGRPRWAVTVVYRGEERLLSSWCRKCTNRRQRDYIKANPSKANSYNRANYAKKRLEVLSHYSQGKIECACCGENHIEFLALDHIEGGGRQHRKKHSGAYFYHSIVKAGFPAGLQVLCHNCNLAKGFYGECPHQKESRS